jgi:trehalose synthase
MQTAEISPAPADRFEAFVSAEPMGRFRASLDAGAQRFADRTLWHVNSTPQGGGVAEMLRSLLGYLLGAGIRTRWTVIDGDDAFFNVTKRIHHLLHGSRGDHGPLGTRERRTYERNLADDVRDLVGMVRAGDAVVLHDPQTLGLAPALRDAGAHIVWICHVGVDQPNELARAAWDFLRPYVDATDAQVFTRRSYLWDGLPPERVEVIPPCIDAFSPKNQPLDASTVRGILRAAGLIDDEEAPATPSFVREEGTRGVVLRSAELDGELLPPSARIVLQVSRWDPLKDPVGLMRAFVDHAPSDPSVRLVLAGPEAGATADDPEARETLAEVRAVREGLPIRDRERVLIASLPMGDVDENAAIVNALQRRAVVVLQKSLAEGFGLTVAEAMWKERPVIGSRVGGIQDQIVDGVSGLLVDPTDHTAVGRAIADLLGDPKRAGEMGRRAHTRVGDEFLPPRYLTRLLDLLERVAGRSSLRSGSGSDR